MMPPRELVKSGVPGMSFVLVTPYLRNASVDKIKLAGKKQG